MAKQYTDEEILAYKTKAPTDVAVRFSAWMKEKLELEFPTPKAEAAFDEAVRLSVALRMIFQASPENQEIRGERKTEREDTTATRAAAKEEKKAAKDKAKAKPEPQATSADEAPAKGGKASKAAKAAKSTPAKDSEDTKDTAVAPAGKKSAPKKAARTGAAAPF